MRKIYLFSCISLILTACNNRYANNQGASGPAPPAAETASVAKLPKPSHVVVLIMENHSYAEIFEAKDAPNFNTLAKNPQSVVFTQSYAIGHPSQPNYLALFSGGTQGSTDDEIPANYPFTTANLGSELITSGFSFAIYSEDLPDVGFDGKWAKGQKYARKHNPVPNWIGKGLHQIPAYTNLPFTYFPVSDFDSLPTVSFVVPNQDNDMHDGTIAQADTWFAEHLENYRKWAATHNSLLIITFDEDDESANNQITTIFYGPMVKGGKDSLHITHYTVLRTIEDFYHLSHAGHAAEASPVDNCWY